MAIEQFGVLPPTSSAEWIPGFNLVDEGLISGNKDYQVSGYGHYTFTYQTLSPLAPLGRGNSELKATADLPGSNYSEDMPNFTDYAGGTNSYNEHIRPFFNPANTTSTINLKIRAYEAYRSDAGLQLYWIDYIGSHMFMGGQYGLIKTDPNDPFNDANWEYNSFTIGDGHIRYIVEDGSNNLFLFGSQNQYLSTDEGSTWTQIDTETEYGVMAYSINGNVYTLTQTNLHYKWGTAGKTTNLGTLGGTRMESITDFHVAGGTFVMGNARGGAVDSLPGSLIYTTNPELGAIIVSGPFGSWTQTHAIGELNGTWYWSGQNRQDGERYILTTTDFTQWATLVDINAENANGLSYSQNTTSESIQNYPPGHEYENTRLIFRNAGGGSRMHLYDAAAGTFEYLSDNRGPNGNTITNGFVRKYSKYVPFIDNPDGAGYYQLSAFDGDYIWQVGDLKEFTGPAYIRVYHNPVGTGGNL